MNPNPAPHQFFSVWLEHNFYSFMCCLFLLQWQLNSFLMNGLNQLSRSSPCYSLKVGMWSCPGLWEMRENILDHREKNWQTWLFILFLDIVFYSWDYYNHLVTTLRMKPTLTVTLTVNLQTTWVWIAQVHFQFSSFAQSCLTLCDPMNCSMPGLPLHHQLPEFTQTHVRWVGDAIQPSHPVSSLSPPAPNPSQNQGLFQRVSSLHQVAKVLEFQLQHQFFQWTPRTDL